MTQREGCRYAVAIARRRSHIVISTVLIMLLGTITVFAQEFGENRVLFGTLNKSCGTWTQLRPAGASLAPTLIPPIRTFS